VPRPPFRDAEAWLAERGVERDPLHVALDPPADAGDAGQAGAATPAASRPTVSVRQAQGMAADAADDAIRHADERASTPDPTAPRLDEDVTDALAFVRRSTANRPQSEGRLRAKLEARGTPAAAIDAALERARRERLVDDRAMVAALVEERRRKGHAPARIRRDLRARGFDEPLLDAALRGAEAEDPEAAAFAVARAKADGLTGVPTDTAFRRVAAHVARRGFPEGLARKVARDAVFSSRDPDRVTGH
jgi:regulatory protein